MQDERPEPVAEDGAETQRRSTTVPQRTSTLTCVGDRCLDPGNAVVLVLRSPERIRDGVAAVLLDVDAGLRVGVAEALGGSGDIDGLAAAVPLLLAIWEAFWASVPALSAPGLRAGFNTSAMSRDTERATALGLV
mmetsp:Transcript_95581/g.270432  ORF Transcript_95581/g.270432 Transcript_95581/m.270432 type:complete len:135 (-) Transcript_95581:620-1024(-)